MSSAVLRFCVRPFGSVRSGCGSARRARQRVGLRARRGLGVLAAVVSVMGQGGATQRGTGQVVSPPSHGGPVSALRLPPAWPVWMPCLCVPHCPGALEWVTACGVCVRVEARRPVGPWASVFSGAGRSCSTRWAALPGSACPGSQKQDAYEYLGCRKKADTVWGCFRRSEQPFTDSSFVTGRHN